MYKKLLVPLDGSALSNSAAEHALKMAANMDAEIVFLHVIPALPPYVKKNGNQAEGVYQQVHEELRKSGNQIMEQAMTEFMSHWNKLDKKVIWGNPAMEICREAKEGMYDLIVIGSRGMGETKGYLMGNVSNRVIRHATCPVLVVR